MNIEQQVLIIDTIREKLESYKGQRLRIRANKGRSKIDESEGVLTEVHPSLFLMDLDRKRGRTARQSYQYVDVLVGTVELSQNGEPLFGKFIEDDADEDLDLIDQDSDIEDEEE